MRNEKTCTTNSIRELSKEEYEAVNIILLNDDAITSISDALATVTKHTSDEWSNTIVCAVSDYVGHGGCV